MLHVLFMSISNFYEHKPKSGEAEQLVIMLHGVGSNGQDLVSLAPILENYLSRAVFISPDAPFACDMVPPGYPNSYQWFSLQDRDPDAMLSGVESVFPLVEEFIEVQLERYNLTADKLALLGFSQGTMTSLYVAPRLKSRIAGVLGYSGALLWDEKTAKEKLQKMPIHLIHGEADNVVPVQARAMAQNTLKVHGYDVTGHTTPGLAHSIDQAGIESGGNFLKSLFAG